MARPKKPVDSVKVFELGKHGLSTVYRALVSNDRSIQIAAARVMHEAARQLPDAIERDLRAAGDASRRTRA